MDDLDFDAELIYSHLTELREKAVERQILRHFRDLFFNTDRYYDIKVRDALCRIFTAHSVSDRFSYIFHRCCRTLIHYWLIKRCWWLTGELLRLIEDETSKLGDLDNFNPHADLFRNFLNSEEYDRLQDLSRVAAFIPPGEVHTVEFIANLVCRYPYLYPHYLRDVYGSDSGFNAVKTLQYAREQEFGKNLYDYTRYLERSSRPVTDTVIQEVPNPSRLSEAKVKIAILQFSGKVDGKLTYRESAAQFLNCFDRLPSHRAVKQQIWNYLESPIHYPGFNSFLQGQLLNSQKTRDNQRPSPKLLVTSCRELIDSLLPLSQQTNNQNLLMFTNMIDNMELGFRGGELAYPGATVAIGLLLKIALLCEKLQDGLKQICEHIAQRFADLFRYYERHGHRDQSIQWLLDCLENWLIASTIQFGSRLKSSEWSLILNG